VVSVRGVARNARTVKGFLLAVGFNRRFVDKEKRGNSPSEDRKGVCKIQTIEIYAMPNVFVFLY
jgi:hypothetical protein